MEQQKSYKYIMYCRKSTDAEDRQVYSTEDQKRELQLLVDSKNLSVVTIIEEAKSAKKPGRPQYDEMIRMLSSGEANGILCWKLNRLARNPISGGEIQWLLQQGIIKSIVTPSREYLPTDNVLMMAVEFGMANQFILDLSQDVKRGLNAKVEKGWRPGYAPIGYLNDKYGDKGGKKVLVDGERFLLVRKMWDLLLTNTHTVPSIHRIARDVWGLQTRKSSKLRLGHVYKIFSNSFYCTEFKYNGVIYKGKHKAMITPEEYDMAQLILGRKGKPRPKTKRLPFTGLIECGECGGMITADEKIKKIKSTCTTKRYIYHRCTKSKKDVACHQSPISYDNMASQIEACLESITIPKSFVLWAVKVLQEQHKIEAYDRDAITRNLERDYRLAIQQIDNLVNVYISPDNLDKSLLTDMEFKEKKNQLVKEKNRIEYDRQNLEARIDHWLDTAEKSFWFAERAKEVFDKGDFETKTNILRAMGQHFSLKDKKLHIQLHEPFLVFQKQAKTIQHWCEPETVSNNGTKVALGANLSG